MSWSMEDQWQTELGCEVCSEGSARRGGCGYGDSPCRPLIMHEFQRDGETQCPHQGGLPSRGPRVPRPPRDHHAGGWEVAGKGHSGLTVQLCLDLPKISLEAKNSAILKYMFSGCLGGSVG